MVAIRLQGLAQAPESARHHVVAIRGFVELLHWRAGLLRAHRQLPLPGGLRDTGDPECDPRDGAVHYRRSAVHHWWDLRVHRQPHLQLLALHERLVGRALQPRRRPLLLRGWHGASLGRLVVQHALRHRIGRLLRGGRDHDHHVEGRAVWSHLLGGPQPPQGVRHGVLQAGGEGAALLDPQPGVPPPLCGQCCRFCPQLQHDAGADDQGAEGLHVHAALQPAAALLHPPPSARAAVGGHPHAEGHAVPPAHDRSARDDTYSRHEHTCFAHQGHERARL
mmetsp:Transcript_113100/g.156116  ORF Transcript_113100/g.156116 Transcript_113100/m.156116 type:complete len:278 (-) Transcript_113100:286-1119(-)